MELIESFEELTVNIFELSKELSEGNKYALDLIKNGKTFVVSESNGDLQFFPSRFIGYKNNTLSLHTINKDFLDGRDTNIAITNILQERNKQDELMETYFNKYCNSLGIAPPNNKRTFWVLPEVKDLVDKSILLSIESSNLSKTEKVNLTKARLGQGKFRTDLLKKWGACCLTGIKVEMVLKASHIKPWSKSNNYERLDSNNGLLLTANADSLFDGGLISFDNSGNLIKSTTITENELIKILGKSSFNLELNEIQQKYMAYHREIIFQK